MMRRFALFILLTLAYPIYAIETFVISDIQIEGLQRISPGAVFVALPVRVGDEMNDQVSSASIEALFGTGFFDDVRLQRDGDILIISVVERPTISEVNFDGNRKLKDDAIENALRVAGLSAGNVYNPELVDAFKQELQTSYVQVGHFSVQIYSSVAPLDRNRVELTFTISEGQVALIKEIKLVGNSQISDKDIFEEMGLSTKKTLGFLNRKNRYNREQLRADLESISSLYLNQGYIEFSLLSARTFIADDLESILIVITMEEGNQYEFGELSIESSEEVMPPEELEKLVQQPEEEIYSFEEVSNTRNAISDSFANIGYGRAEVDALPTIHDDEQKIDVRYVVKPGKLTYIRNITFKGNFSTSDEVLRREMRVLEGGLYTAREIQQSNNRLNRLGIFGSVNFELLPVDGTEDQVDLVVTVQERLTGSLLFGVGYSESEKTSFNFSISQTNLFGTGKKLSAGATYGKIEQSLNMEYTNPYYTVDGVSRTITFEYRERDTSESDTTLIYEIDYFTGGMDFTYPVSEEGAVGIGFDASRQEFSLLDATATDYAVREYIGGGRKNQNLSGTISYRRDTRNRAFFASDGSDLYVGLRTTGGDESNLALTASYAHFFPIGDKMTLRLSTQLDVASEDLPFYRNYYMTGYSTIRGFNSGQLGAKQMCRQEQEPTAIQVPTGVTKQGDEYRYDDSDKLWSKQYTSVNSEGNDVTHWYRGCNSDRSLGGNVRMLNRAELFFPFFGADEIDDKRISIFVDLGGTFLHKKGVYGTASQALGLREKFSFSNMRSAAGIGFEWLSPIGPFGVHYAIPVKEKPGDDADRFQITLGTFFE